MHQTELFLTKHNDFFACIMDPGGVIRTQESCATLPLPQWPLNVKFCTPKMASDLQNIIPNGVF